MIEANVHGLVTGRKLTKHKVDGALSLLKGVLDYSEFKDVDMVIKAVIKNFSLKQTIFSDLEKICPSHCILATNTSTIDLNIIGEKIRSQDRITKFANEMQEMTQRASEQGTPPLNELDVWRNVARAKKGKIYSLRIESTIVARYPNIVAQVLHHLTECEEMNLKN